MAKLTQYPIKSYVTLCQCAHCVEEFSRKKIINVNSIADNIKPIAIRPLGNYAISVSWSDGHSSSIYPYTELIK